jgi:hypothetical protein
MQLHLDEIATKITPGAHAILLLDQAGWHGDQGPQGSKQHLDLAAAATRPRKYLAIHAAELAIEPSFQILRRYRRSLLLRLEHAHRAAVENHVHRAPRLGSRRSLNLRIGNTSQGCSGQALFNGRTKSNEAGMTTFSLKCDNITDAWKIILARSP